jgi:hypothetical protein
VPRIGQSRGRNGRGNLSGRLDKPATRSGARCASRADTDYLGHGYDPVHPVKGCPRPGPGGNAAGGCGGALSSLALPPGRAFDVRGERLPGLSPRGWVGGEIVRLSANPPAWTRRGALSRRSMPPRPRPAEERLPLVAGEARADTEATGAAAWGCRGAVPNCWRQT